MSMVKTNVGEMPIEDYLETVALQYGFDSYKELRYNGFVVDIEEKTAKNKTPSPKHNASKTVLSMHRQGLEPWTP